MSTCRRCKQEYNFFSKHIGTDWCKKCHQEVSGSTFFSDNSITICQGTPIGSKENKILIFTKRSLMAIPVDNREVEVGGKFHPKGSNVEANVMLLLFGGLFSGSQKVANLGLASTNRFKHLFSLTTDELGALYPQHISYPYSQISLVTIQKSFMKGTKVSVKLNDNTGVTYAVTGMPRTLSFDNVKKKLFTALESKINLT